MDIKLQPTSFAPIYVQVRDQLAHLIRDQKLSSGSNLPAPSVLAQKIAVDSGEVTRAYFELEQGGLVTKRKGKDLFGKEKTTYMIN